MTKKIQPVIMCGGAGTRVWPESRETMPKQFIALIGKRSTFQETILRVDRSDLRIADRRHQSRLSISGQGATRRHRRGGEDRDRALAARFRTRRRSRRGVGGAARSGIDSGGVRLRPRHYKARRVPRRMCFGRRRRGTGLHRHLGRAPGRTGDRLRLHQARPGDRRRARIGDRCVCREAGARRRRTLRRGGLSLEFGQFLFSRRRHARRVEGFRARNRRRGRRGDRKSRARPRLSRPRRRGLRQIAEKVDRLRRDGAHQARGRRAGRYRLVGHRQLGRGLEAERARRARKLDLGRGRRHRIRQCACSLDGAADRRRRGQGPDRRHDAGRGAGAGARPGRQGQAAGRKSSREQAPRGDRAQADVPAVGLLSVGRSKAPAIKSSASSSRPAIGFRCNGISIAPSIGSSSRAPPR